MALIRVCDKCSKQLETGEGKLNYVDMDYYYKDGWSNVFLPISLTLCEDCFKELTGKEPSEVFHAKVNTEL